MPREQALDIDRRIRHGFDLEDDADVAQMDAGDLLDAFGRAVADAEQVRERAPGAPADLVADREALDRERLLREAVSLAGPLTEEMRGGFAQLLGVPLNALLAIPGGREVLKFSVVSTGGVFQKLPGLEDLSREEREARFDEMWEGFPRWAQIALEEAFDPTNALFVVGGAALAPRLLRSSNAAARFFGEAIRLGPTTFPREIAGVTGARVGFEETEGAPLGVRALAAGGGAVLGAVPDSVVRAGVRGTRSTVARGPRVIKPNPIGGGGPVLDVPPSARELLDLQPVELGLSRRDELTNVLKETTGFGTPSDPIASPLFRERARVLPRVEGQAVVVAESLDDAMREAFVRDARGRIPALANATFPEGPTVQDVAARLPEFAGSLGPQQLDALERARSTLKPWGQLLEEMGIEVGSRADVLDGGFYVPRGNASLAGADDPIRGPATRGRLGGRGSFERPAIFGSQAEGIAAGYEYPPLREVLNAHVRSVGERALDQHVNDFLKVVRDPATGVQLAESVSDRIPAGLRDRVQTLRTQIRGRRIALARQSSRGRAQAGEAARTGRRAGAATDRAARGAERLLEREAAFTPEELAAVRSDLDIAIAQGRTVAHDIGENAQRLRAGRAELTAQERSLLRDAEELADELDAADALTGRDFGQTGRFGGADPADLPPINRPEVRVARGAYDEHLRAADRVQKRVDRMSDRAADFSRKVDESIERGEVLGDIDRGVRDDMVRSRRAERALLRREQELAAGRRELRALEAERGRLQRSAVGAGRRSQAADQRIAATTEQIRDFRGQLDAIEGDWKAAQQRAQQTPRGQLRIPGLEAFTFPEGLAKAARSELDKAARLGESGPPPLQVINALNQLHRSMGATLDNSGPAIQGLLAAADDQRAWAQALKVNFRSWGPEGDRVLGQFIRTFDDSRPSEGRLNSSQWVRFGIHLGGSESEYTIGSALGRVGEAIKKTPGIRQANRAFGFFGDALRLEWADNLLEAELAGGRTLQQIAASGDAHRIAQAANSMTGWSDDRFAGTFGDILLFAPRFLQSRLETTVRAARGSIPARGVVSQAVPGVSRNAALQDRIARRALLKMMGYGVVLTVGINEALGNDTDFRPFVNGRVNSNFLRVRAFERDWTLFGTWNGLARAMMLVGSGEPEQALRGLGSGVVSTGWDVLSGENFIGQPTRDDPEQFLRTVAEALVPFSAQELPALGGQIVEGAREGDVGKVAGGVTGVLGEQAGASSSPLTPFEREQIARDEAVQGRSFTDPVSGESFTVGSFEELSERLGSSAARQEASAGGGELGRIEGERLEEQLSAAAEGVGDREQAFAQIARIGADRLAWAENVQKMLDADEIDPGEARALRRATDFSGRYAQLFRDFRPVFEKDGEPDLSTVDGATDAYVALFDEASDVGGVLDKELFYDELEPRFIGQVGAETFERVQANIGLKNRAQWERDDAKLAEELEAAGAFDLGDEAWRVAAGLHGVAGFASFGDFWQAEFPPLLARLGSRGEAEFEMGRFDVVKEYRSTLSDFRNGWARTNPDLAERGEDLVRWTTNIEQRQFFELIDEIDELERGAPRAGAP